MKKFIIKETRPATAIWTYEVEAVSESEAIAKVFDEGDTNKTPDLTYDVDFEADMEVEVDEETPSSASDEVIVASFTKKALIEYTRGIQERCKTAAIESITNAGIDFEDMVELELDYNKTISVHFDERTLYSEIESAIDEAFETDDESIFDEATDVITFMSKG
jgi:hypothetical protein